MANSALDLRVVVALSAALSVLARDLHCPAEARVCCPDGPTQGKLLTTSTFELPWTEALVRSRETGIGNLIAFSQYEFLIARFPEIPPHLHTPSLVSPVFVGVVFVCYLHCPLCRHNYAPGEYIAATNGGGIRAGLKEGPVWEQVVDEIVPFGNEIRVGLINGTTIRLMLERSVWDIPGGPFLSVQGLRFWYDPARARGSRVQRVEVRSRSCLCQGCAHPWFERCPDLLASRAGSWAGQVRQYPSKVSFTPLVDDKAYTISMNDYIFSGGDGYDLLPSGVRCCVSFGAHACYVH